MLKTDHVNVTSSTRAVLLRSPATVQVFMRRCWKRKRRSKIRHISITNHRACMWRAKPWNPACMKRCSSRSATLRERKGRELVNLCKEKNVGFICMKALSG